MKSGMRSLFGHTVRALAAGAFALVGVAVFGAPAIAACANWGYLSPDIRKSCSSLSIDSGGVLSGTCNKRSDKPPCGRRPSSSEPLHKVEGNSTSIDLEDYIGFVFTPNARSKGYLDWGGTDFADDCGDLNLANNTSGLFLSASCTGTLDSGNQIEDIAVSTKVNGKIVNDGGSLKRSTD